MVEQSRALVFHRGGPWFESRAWHSFSEFNSNSELPLRPLYRVNDDDVIDRDRTSAHGIRNTRERVISAQMSMEMVPSIEIYKRPFPTMGLAFLHQDRRDEGGCTYIPYSLSEGG